MFCWRNTGCTIHYCCIYTLCSSNTVFSPCVRRQSTLWILVSYREIDECLLCLETNNHEKYPQRLRAARPVHRQEATNPCYLVSLQLPFPDFHSSRLILSNPVLMIILNGCLRRMENVYQPRLDWIPTLTLSAGYLAIDLEWKCGVHRRVATVRYTTTRKSKTQAAAGLLSTTPEPLKEERDINIERKRRYRVLHNKTQQRDKKATQGITCQQMGKYHSTSLVDIQKVTICCHLSYDATKTRKEGQHIVWSEKQIEPHQPTHTYPKGTQKPKQGEDI